MIIFRPCVFSRTASAVDEFISVSKWLRIWRVVRLVGTSRSQSALIAVYSGISGSQEQQTT